MTETDVELKVKREKLLNHTAAVALAIHASGRVEAHEDFLEVLKMIPPEIRCCPECGTGPGEQHNSCKHSLDVALGKMVKDWK